MHERLFVEPTAETRPDSLDVEALRESLYDGLLTIEETASALDVSRYTVSRMISAGKLGGVKIKNQRFVPSEDVQGYIKQLRSEAEVRRQAQASNRGPRKTDASAAA